MIFHIIAITIKKTVENQTVKNSFLIYTLHTDLLKLPFVS